VCTWLGPFTYVAQLNTGSLVGLPAFITYNTLLDRLEIVSNVHADNGSYLVRITGSLSDGSETFVEVTINVVGCVVNQVTQVTNAADPDNPT